MALKGQILADFLVKVPQQDANPDSVGWWIFIVDGASRQMGAGVRLQLKAPIGERIEQAIRLDFPSSNNKTEYEAILAENDLATSVSSKENHHTK